MRTLGGRRDFTKLKELAQAVSSRRREIESELQSPGPRRKTYRGRIVCYLAIRDLLGAARTRVDVAAVAPGSLVRSVRGGFVEIVEALRERGVALRVVSTVGTGEEAESRKVAASAELRSMALDTPVRLVICDGEQALFFVRHDPSPHMDAPGDQAVVTDEEGDVKRIRDLFEVLWSAAVPYSSR